MLENQWDDSVVKVLSDKPQDQGFILGIYMEQRENLIPASGVQVLPKPQK